MSNETKPEAAAENKEIKVTLQNPPQYVPAKTPDDLSMLWILERIDKIINDTEHIKSTLDALIAIPPSNGPSDIGGQAKAQAIGDVVRCRETTNQQTLRLLEKMYDDLKPKKTADFSVFTPEHIIELTDSLPPINKESIIRDITNLLK